MQKGFLISFEGDDGSGKTTALSQVARILNVKHKLDVVTFREPGGTEIGDDARRIVHDFKNIPTITEESELLLYLVSRAQNVAENIRPALEDNKIVLLDRFLDSSIAYQGYGRGIGASLVNNLNSFATKGLVPDLTVYFDVEPEVASERRLSSRIAGGEWNRLDAEMLQFHRDVQYAYQTLHAFDTENRWERLDANKTQEEVLFSALHLVESRLQMNGFIEGNTPSVERR